MNDEDQRLRARALAILDEFRRRDAAVAQHVFGDPAWEVVLATHALDEGSGIIPAAVVAKLPYPTSTILRWIGHLTDRDILRTNLDGDGRVALSPTARAYVSGALERLGGDPGG